jgi:hypothetical protein
MDEGVTSNRPFGSIGISEASPACAPASKGASRLGGPLQGAEGATGGGTGLSAVEVLAVSHEMQRPKLGFGLADEIALAEEDPVIEPAERLSRGTIRPPNYGSPRA